jgi:hypothetical protein
MNLVVKVGGLLEDLAAFLETKVGGVPSIDGNKSK